MKKLLFINGHLNAGGCERSLVDVLQHIDYNKYEVDLLLLEDLGDFLEEVPSKVNIVYYDLKKAFGSFGKTMLRAVKNLDWFSIVFRINYLYCSKFGVEKIKSTRFLFKKIQKNYDAIIAYRPGVCTDLAAFTFSANKKISWWHHGVYYDFGNILPSYRQMNHIVTVSKSSAEIVKTYFQEISDKVTVISNMIPVDVFQKKSKEYAVESNIEFTLVSVGRFSEEKNMILCPEVGKCLREAGINFKWILIGNGEEYQKTKELVRKYFLDDCFVFSGTLANPYPYIKNADLMIHPSLVESQGLTVLESMALGTPVIVVDSAGPREFIVNEKNGFLTKPCAKDIAKIITYIKDDRKKLASISNEAKKTIEMFSPELIMEKIYKLFSD